MTLDDYRKTHSWQEAINVGRVLGRLRDELPAAEDGGLSVSLQELVIDLPAAVGRDLLTGQQSRLEVLVRVQAALAVVDAVYPALDVSEAEDAVSDFIRRSQDVNLFNELVPEPVPPVEEPAAVEVSGSETEESEE